MTGFFDTNILIDFLSGVPEAETALQPYSRRCISRLTWMEMLVGARHADDEAAVRRFLAQFELHELSETIAVAAVELRKHHKPRLKMPDAIILASARSLGCRLVTRNTRDFPPDSPDILVPY